MNINRRRTVLSRAVRCESLERRMLLSLAPAGAEFRVNTFTTSSQSNAAIAVDGDGDFVVTWDSYQEGVGGGVGIYAQRYNASGVAQGAEFHVNSTTTGGQQKPAVAMDADGDFVIVWSGYGPGDSDGGIFGRRYNAAGVPQSGEFRANTFITTFQADPAIASDAAGNFVVSWTSSQDGSGQGVYAQRYNVAGAPQGSEFRVNTFTAGNQSFSSTAMDASGNLVIAWGSANQDGSASGVYAQRYNAAGEAQGGEFQVNTFTTGSQAGAAVAMDASGDFAVAWFSPQEAPGNNDVYAQRYNAAGVAQGGEFRVNTTTASTQFLPSVAMDADGDFLVAWVSYGQDGSDAGVYAQSFNASGAPQGIEFRVNTFTAGNQNNTAVAMDADGNAVVVWQSIGQDGSGYGVYAHRYSESNPDTAAPMAGGLFLNGTEVMPGELRNESGSSLVLSFSEDMSVAGGTSGANSAANRANYVLQRNGVNVSSEIASAAFAFNPASGKFEAILTFSSFLVLGEYTLSARDTLRDLAGNALDGNFDGAAGGDFTRAFVVASREFRVNSTTPNTQRSPAIASDADGDFVVVWESGDGNGYGIYAQRYNRAAIPQGHEFRVNTTTSLQQIEPSVAMDADGDFVVVWSGNVPLDSQGIAMQRFNALGVPQGGEIRVNTFTTNVQEQPTVAMDADGNFVVVWTRAAATPHIFAQRFNAAGVQQASEFSVDDVRGRQPDVAMDADGDFVVVYTVDYFPGFGVNYRRFNASGTAQGSGVPVNSETDSEEVPAVAMGADGNFVVAWTRFTNFDERDILVRRFDAAGVPQASAFLVNTLTAGRQEAPEIEMDASGCFVVSWPSENQDGSGFGVFARRYNAAGTPFTPEFRVNTFTTGDQVLPAVGMLSNEEFVITWTSHGQIPNSLDVYGQLFLGPQASDPEFIFDTAPHRVRFRFSEDVSASLGSDDLILENLTTMQTIPADQLLVTYDTTTNTATFRFAGLVSSILPDGNYRATLLAAGISSPAGVPMQANHVFNFFFLNGDANHDGRVNLNDFNILAANFGQSPRNFTQGDFTYDTIVNLADFNVLASRFGQGLAAEPLARIPIRNPRGGEDLRRLLEELT